MLISYLNVVLVIPCKSQLWWPLVYHPWIVFVDAGMLKQSSFQRNGARCCVWTAASFVTQAAKWSEVMRQWKSWLHQTKYRKRYTEKRNRKFFYCTHCFVYGINVIFTFSNCAKLNWPCVHRIQVNLNVTKNKMNYLFMPTFVIARSCHEVNHFTNSIAVQQPIWGPETNFISLINIKPKFWIFKSIQKWSRLSFFLCQWHQPQIINWNEPLSL